MTRTARPSANQMLVTPPPMHEGQLEVLNDPARFKMLRAGRRWRKSGLGVVQAFTGYDGPEGRRFRGALDGGQIGWWVPSLTSRYLVTDWNPIKSLAAQLPGSRIEEANHRAILPSGGSILMLTADTPDSGRGLGLDGAVLDEASLYPPQLWTESIRATLVDKLGWALFLFTPKGLNWIHDVETAALPPAWKVWQFASHDNPSLDREELADLTREMSTLVYRQEILAEYVTAGAGLFDRSWLRHWFPALDDAGKVVGYQLGEGQTVSAQSCRRFATVDLAWSLDERADYTVISSWAVTPHNHLVLLDVVRGHIDGPDIVSTLRAVRERWGIGYFAVERATRQLAIVREAVRAGLPVREVRPDKDKIARALPATARMEQGTVWFPQPNRVPAIVDCEAELIAFPMGQHDDFVDTLSYACLEIAKAGRASTLKTFGG